MMINRTQAEKKQFKQRKDGLMKKANDLQKLCRVKVAVFVEDGGDWFIYRSTEGWPLGFEIESAQTLLPDDFTTLREATREKSSVAAQLSSSYGSSSSSSPALTAQSVDDAQQVLEGASLEAQIGHAVALKNTGMIDTQDADDNCQRHIESEAWSNAVGNVLAWHPNGHSQPAIPYNHIHGTMSNDSNQYLNHIASQPNVFPTPGSINSGQEIRGWRVKNDSGKIGLVGNYSQCMSNHQSQIYQNPQ